VNIHVISALFGGAAVVAGIRIAYLMRVSLRQSEWVRAAGVVTRSVVEDRVETHAAVVEYTYSVDRTQYFGKTVRSVTLQLNWSSPARRICEKYPVGQRIEAFVCPTDPRRAVLEVGVDPLTFLALGAVCGLCLSIAFVTQLQ
jgi:hypothetical protein